MCKFIGVEILAANALIEVLENSVSSSISFEKLEEYGLKVIKFLEQTYNEQAVILYNENYYGNRILNYSEYFEVNGLCISVKEGVTPDRLRQRFRAPLAYEILKAILCEDAKNVIIGV